MISFMALYMCQVLNIVDFLGSRRMETAPTSIEVFLRPTQSQSDEPSDLRGSLIPTSEQVNLQPLVPIIFVLFFFFYIRTSIITFYKS